MSNIYKTVLITSSLLLVIGAGCTQTPTTNEGVNQNSTNTNKSNVVVNDNTNEVVVDNTNVEPVNDNMNEAVENDNVNAADDITADTSDWLTYTNDTTPLTFKYPKGWKLEHNQDDSDFTDILDNNDVYDHELVNIYVRWSNRHEDIVYDSGIINSSLDKWLSCDYIYDLQKECSIVTLNGIEVVRRTGQIEPPFGDDYVALAYKQNNFTVVIDARSLLRESANEIGNSNLDGLKYINAVIETISIN